MQLMAELKEQQAAGDNDELGIAVGTTDRAAYGQPVALRTVQLIDS
jgi:hypothetical protein